jgi:hypothetical protein
MKKIYLIIIIVIGLSITSMAYGIISATQSGERYKQEIANTDNIFQSKGFIIEDATINEPNILITCENQEALIIQANKLNQTIIYKESPSTYIVFENSETAWQYRVYSYGLDNIVFLIIGGMALMGICLYGGFAYPFTSDKEETQ